MCGRYSQTGPDPSVLRARFPIGERVEVRRRFNVAPGDHVLAVTTDRDGAPRGELLRWGLVPHWADAPAKLGLKLINARSETMAEKPAFRDAFASRRCLVIADGFYEWEKRPDGTRQRWWVTRPDGEPLAFAGLWATWRGRPDVEPLRTCRVVPPQARPQLAHGPDPLHDRHDAGQRAARARPRPHAGDAPARRRGGVSRRRDARLRPARPVRP